MRKSPPKQTAEFRKRRLLSDELLDGQVQARELATAYDRETRRIEALCHLVGGYLPLHVFREASDAARRIGTGRIEFAALLASHRRTLDRAQSIHSGVGIARALAAIKPPSPHPAKRSSDYRRAA